MTRCERAAQVLAGLAMVLCLAACATKPEGATPAGAAAAPPAAAASAPATVSYNLLIDAPEDLQKLLMTYLDLSRFRAESEGITATELDRLAAAAPAQARSLLETEGYFNSQVKVERSVGFEDDLPLIELKVEPGQRTVVMGWTLDVDGPLQDKAAAGDVNAKSLIERLRAHWRLHQGDPFRQPDWSAAKNETMALLRSDGYPTAEWTRTEANVDVQKQEAVLALQLDSGKLYRLGELRIEGLSRYDERAIRNLADFGPGTPYSEKRLLDYQERIASVGLFEGATVEARFDPTNPEATPVVVRVREQTLQSAITGVGFSTNTGPRATLEHTHRRPFGWHLQVHNKLEIGRDLNSWEGELLSDPGSQQYRKLAAVAVSRLESDTDVTYSSRVRLGRSLETELIERLIFGEYLNDTVDNALGSRRSEAVSGNYNWTWRGVDSIILPSKGLTTTIQLGSGWAMSNYTDSGLFARLYTRNTVYWPLGRGWLSSARLELAEVFARDDIGIPDTLLFRAGGDGSVRGYGYRTLGPLENGVLVSGRKLMTASVEVGHAFSSKNPSLGWAVFVDGGNAANEWNELTPALGYGLGLRWRSPVGPFRIDWAYGEEEHKSRLHLSVGIAF